MNAVSLFSQLLVDKSPIGQGYLNILQLKCHYLLPYLISSLLISGNFEPLHDQVLPLILQEKSRYTDVYTSFLEALYE